MLCQVMWHKKLFLSLLKIFQSHQNWFWSPLKIFCSDITNDFGSFSKYFMVMSEMILDTTQMFSMLEYIYCQSMHYSLANLWLTIPFLNIQNHLWCHCEIFWVGSKIICDIIMKYFEQDPKSFVMSLWNILSGIHNHLSVLSSVPSAKLCALCWAGVLSSNHVAAIHKFLI